MSGVSTAFTRLSTQVAAQGTTQAFAATASAATNLALTNAVGGSLLTAGITIAVQIGLSYAFPNVTKIEGQRVGEIPLSFTAEGAPIPLSLGPSNRLGGTVIYVSRLKETKLIEEIDTSGISSGDYTELLNYDYSVNLAVAVGEGVISNVTKIWADGVPIYRFVNARPQEVDTILSVEKISFFNGYLPVIMRLKSTDIDKIDLSRWTRPSLIDITGFANPTNNVIAGLVVRVHVDPVTPTTTYLDIFNPLAVTEAAGPSVTISQSFSQIQGFPFFRRGKTADSIQIYKGTSTQIPDAVIQVSQLLETILTGVKTPAYRHISYVVFKNLRLSNFNNRIPQLEFLVEKATSQTLGDAISTLLQRGGVPSRNIDVSDIQDTPLDGYTIYGPMAMTNAIQPLIQAFNLVAYEKDGTLIFKHRENADIIPLNATELAAHSSDQDAPRELDITDVASFNLPKTVNINYFDIANNNLKANQQERRVNAPVDTNMSIDFPITMTAARASEIASRFLWGAWVNRQSVFFTLPPSRLTLSETEIVTVTSGGNKFRVILTEINRGHDYKLECSGLIESIEALNFTKVVQDKPDIGKIVDEDPTGESLIALGFIDIAPLHNSHVNTSGAYFALADYDRDLGWEGSQLYIGTTDHTDDGLSLAAQFPNESLMGYSTTVLADGDPETWDIANTVNVELFSGTLTSKTDLQVFEGQNIALLGSEIIAFQNVMLNADGSYTLSTLLRGLRGTQSKTTTHAINDRFIPLITSNIGYLGIGSEHLQSSLGFKAISIGANLVDYPLYTHTFVGGAATPFAPAEVVGVRDASNNITVTWERVTTKLWKQFGSQPFPPNEFDDELYTIEYRDGSDVLIETRTNIGPTRTDTITAAQHGEGANPVKIQIFHQGTLVALGPGSTSITV